MKNEQVADTGVLFSLFFDSPCFRRARPWSRQINSDVIKLGYIVAELHFFLLSPIPLGRWGWARTG
jgi:hypothetical protein